MELYIHIPFCIKKCKYCDFLSAPADEMTQERYFNALISQIKAFGEREQKRTEGPRTVTSVFIGGGTPSVWSADRIAAIMNTLKSSFDIEPDAEISIEANPGTLEPEKLSGYLACGINRLSLGLQSSDGVLLKVLGRIPTYEDFEKNYQAARDAGFKNINVDIMSGLPGQSLAT
ncbi:MAG: radical SAM protein, partial [Lachnospiraceae bacterium]|nr:radical SAM protein [Lachnospiraceae bacterium]